MTVVSGDVVVHLFPESFDGVVFGGVGRQKVQLNAPSECFEGMFSFRGFVDDVVVEHKVDFFGAAVSVVDDVK